MCDVMNPESSAEMAPQKIEKKLRCLIEDITIKHQRELVAMTENSISRTRTRRVN